MVLTMMPTVLMVLTMMMPMMLMVLTMIMPMMSMVLMMSMLAVKAVVLAMVAATPAGHPAAMVAAMLVVSAVQVVVLAVVALAVMALAVMALAVKSFWFVVDQLAEQQLVFVVEQPKATAAPDHKQPRQSCACISDMIPSMQDPFPLGAAVDQESLVVD